VGPKEAESGEIALRDRIDGDLGTMKIGAAIAKLKEEIATRTVRQAISSTIASVTETDKAKSEY